MRKSRIQLQREDLLMSLEGIFVQLAKVAGTWWGSGSPWNHCWEGVRLVGMGKGRIVWRCMQRSFGSGSNCLVHVWRSTGWWSIVFAVDSLMWAIELVYLLERWQGCLVSHSVTAPDLASNWILPSGHWWAKWKFCVMGIGQWLLPTWRSMKQSTNGPRDKLLQKI